MDANVLLQQGLLSAIEEEVSRIQKSGLFNLEFEVSGNPIYLEAQKELLTFRIIQESFNNSIKHSGAKNIVLHLDFRENELTIDLSDDGKGFDTEQARSGNRAGLHNIRNRVSMLGGDMRIQSEPGKGSRLNFIIPYQHHAL